jgi:hypothetical protein
MVIRLAPVMGGAVTPGETRYAKPPPARLSPSQPTGPKDSPALSPAANIVI